MVRVKHLVVGAGISGAIMAERIASELKEPVTIIDAREHIGGNCYDYRDKNGIMIHKYGPHIFHTSNKKVWDYLSRFTKWHPFFLKVQAYIDGKTIPFSFNLNSLQKCFPTAMADCLSQKLIDIVGYGNRISILKLREQKDKNLSFLADYIYQKGFLNYYKKQWGVSPEDLDPSIADRVPISISTSDDYFVDKYQGIPKEGYTVMIEKIIDNPLIELKLNTPYDAKEFEADNIYYTGPIDEFFRYELGELPYRSLTFDIREENTPYFQSSVVVSYPNNYDFTRICEHKYFLDDKSDKTVISLEYPAAFERGKNERYYPIPCPKNHELYNKYLEKAKAFPHVYFFGRLGDYKYYNMDLAVARVLDLFDNINEMRKSYEK